MVPLFQIFALFRLTNTLGSLILAYPIGLMPFACWLLMGYYRSIPEELEESELIDGCGKLQAFRRIVFPLVLPALVVVALFFQPWVNASLSGVGKAPLSGLQLARAEAQSGWTRRCLRPATARAAGRRRARPQPPPRRAVSSCRRVCRRWSRGRRVERRPVV